MWPRRHPASNMPGNTPWPVEDDRELWTLLGGLPRTAGGNLQSNPIVNALVQQLASKYGRTTGAIKSRLKHLDNPTQVAHQKLNPGALIAASPYAPEQDHPSSTGWQSWPVVKSGDWGLVFIAQGRGAGRFGYYDDEEDEDECLVYFGAPLSGDGPYMYPRRALRQPPFDGEYRSMGGLPAAQKFAAGSPGLSFALQSFGVASLATSPRRSDTKMVTLDMLRAGRTIPQIASARGLQASTIEGHLTDLHGQGLCPEATQLFGMTPAIRSEIRAIDASLNGADVGKLRPIKDRCVHSYALIKMALA